MLLKCKTEYQLCIVFLWIRIAKCKAAAANTPVGNQKTIVEMPKDGCLPYKLLPDVSAQPAAWTFP